MTSTHASGIEVAEQNHVQDTDHGSDLAFENRTAAEINLHRKTNSTASGDPSCVDGVRDGGVVTERTTVISTKKVSWKRTDSGGGREDIETISSAMRSTNIAQLNREEPEFEQTYFGGEEPAAASSGVPCVENGDNSTAARSSRFLDQLLHEGDPPIMIHSPDVERTSETISLQRPKSLTVAPEKIRKQSSSSAPSPLSSPSGTQVPFPHHQGPTHTSWMPSSTSPGVLDKSTTEDLGNGRCFRPMGSHFVIVAIDFGTTMSGYAFSFVRDPSSIHMMRKWEGGDPGVINQKTPTTLLLNPDGEFHSFGFAARDFYHDLDAKEAKRWLYFEKFKMALHYSTKKKKVPTATLR